MITGRRPAELLGHVEPPIAVTYRLFECSFHVLTNGMLFIATEYRLLLFPLGPAYVIPVDALYIYHRATTIACSAKKKRSYPWYQNMELWYIDSRGQIYAYVSKRTLQWFARVDLKATEKIKPADL